MAWHVFALPGMLGATPPPNTLCLNFSQKIYMPPHSKGEHPRSHFPSFTVPDRTTRPLSQRAEPYPRPTIHSPTLVGEMPPSETNFRAVFPSMQLGCPHGCVCRHSSIHGRGIVTEDATSSPSSAVLPVSGLATREAHSQVGVHRNEVRISFIIYVDLLPIPLLTFQPLPAPQ